MRLFYSTREKKLWIWAFVVFLAIYSTLGLGGLFIENPFLIDLLIPLYMGSFFTLVVILIIGLVRYQLKRHFIWLLLGIFLVAVMVVVRMNMSAIERTHLFEYALLSSLVFYALMERRQFVKAKIHPAILTIIICFAIGWIDEGVQYFIPGRVYDFQDVIFNLSAILITVTFAWVLSLSIVAKRLSRK